MHPKDADLALYAGKDLGLWPRFRIARHLRGCEQCSRSVEELRGLREWMGGQEAELPAEVDWRGLAAEMRANIRLGLAAGRCVALADAQPARPHWLRPALALPVLLVVVATFLAESLHPPLKPVAALEPPRAPVAEVVLQSSSTQTGVEQGGHGFALLHPRGQNVMSSVRGEAVRVRYVDSDTGQVTISYVYAH
jgi:hypothetical protein